MDKSFLLKLPDELLYEICHLAALSEIKVSYQTRGSLVKVSKRLRSHCTPLLYRYLGVHYGLGDGWVAINDPDVLANKVPLKRLHRTLRCGSNASLRQHCKTLQLFINNPLFNDASTEDISMVTDILSWLSGVDSLTLGGSIGNASILSFLELAVRHMPGLRNILYAALPTGAINFWNALHPDTLKLSKLRFLCFDGQQPQPANRSIMNDLPSPVIKSILIDEHCGGLGDLEIMVRKSKGLEHFKLSLCENDAGRLNLSTFSSALLVQRNTLKSLHITQTAVEGILDLSQFTQLEALHLYIGRLTEYDFTDALGYKILPPQLKRLGLDFAHDWGMRWVTMDTKAESWLAALAAYAVKVNCPLEEVFVRFEPDARYWHATRDDTASGYPWARLDRIKQCFKGLGIGLGHSRPSITRRQWECCESFPLVDDFEIDAGFYVS